MAQLRHGWPFLVAAAAILVLAYIGWRLWPLSLDPCGSGSGSYSSVSGITDDFCGGKRTTAGLVAPIGLAAFGVVVGALGLIPVRRRGG